MWFGKGSQDDEPSTDCEHDEEQSLTAHNEKSRHNPREASGDDWKTATLISDEYDGKSSVAEMICNSSALTKAGSKRSARKAWFPQLSAATAPLAVQVEVEQYRPNTYPEGCDLPGLEEENRERLKKRWYELSQAAPTTDDHRSDEYGMPRLARPPKRATFKSRCPPWYSRASTSANGQRPDRFTSSGSRYPPNSQLQAAITASLARLAGMADLPPPAGHQSPEQTEYQSREHRAGSPNHRLFGPNPRSSSVRWSLSSVLDNEIDPIFAADYRQPASHRDQLW